MQPETSAPVARCRTCSAGLATHNRVAGLAERPGRGCLKPQQSSLCAPAGPDHQPPRPLERAFYEAFERVLQRLGHDDLLPKLQAHVDHPSTVTAIQALMERHGFAFRRVVEESLMMRFLDGSAFLRHYFVRLGFLGGWKAMIPADDAATVFRRWRKS